MTDDCKPQDDDEWVVAQVHQAREELFAEFGYDLGALFEAIRAREETSGARYATPSEHGKTPPAEDAAKTSADTSK